MRLYFLVFLCTERKMKFSASKRLSKCEQICRKLWIYSNLLKIFMTKNYFFIMMFVPSIFSSVIKENLISFNLHCAALIDSSHNEDGRRAYQFIKFLVTLGNKISQTKEYLVQSTTKWQWAINWLKQKVTWFFILNRFIFSAKDMITLSNSQCKH